MAIKTFTDFTSKKIETTPVTTPVVASFNVIKEQVKTSKNNEVEPVNSVKPDVKEIQKPVKEKQEQNIFESLVFVGNIVKFPDNFKPSVAQKLLESNKFSKNKLHFIISKQPNNSILVVKYNEKTQINVKEFMTSLFEFYKQNEALKPLLKDIVVEGNKSFSFVKNIPSAKYENVDFIEIINTDLLKLFSKL